MSENRISAPGTLTPTFENADRWPLCVKSERAALRPAVAGAFPVP